MRYELSRYDKGNYYFDSPAFDNGPYLTARMDIDYYYNGVL